jgi:hypothetical protein
MKKYSLNIIVVSIVSSIYGFFLLAISISFFLHRYQSDDFRILQILPVTLQFLIAISLIFSATCLLLKNNKSTIYLETSLWALVILTVYKLSITFSQGAVAGALVILLPVVIFLVLLISNNEQYSVSKNVRIRSKQLLSLYALRRDVSVSTMKIYSASMIVVFILCVLSLWRVSHLFIFFSSLISSYIILCVAELFLFRIKKLNISTQLAPDKNLNRHWYVLVLLMLIYSAYLYLSFVIKGYSELLHYSMLFLVVSVIVIGKAPAKSVVLYTLFLGLLSASISVFSFPANHWYALAYIYKTLQHSAGVFAGPASLLPVDIAFSWVVFRWLSIIRSSLQRISINEV